MPLLDLQALVLSLNCSWKDPRPGPDGADETINEEKLNNIYVLCTPVNNYKNTNIVT